jgi:hypothetical protein
VTSRQGRNLEVCADLPELCSVSRRLRSDVTPTYRCSAVCSLCKRYTYHTTGPSSLKLRRASCFALEFYASPAKHVVRSRMAEGVGFEPTIRLPVYTLSKRAPSATRPSLRRGPVMARPEAFGKGWGYPGRGETRSVALRSQDRSSRGRFWRSRICGASLRAAPRPGHVLLRSRASPYSAACCSAAFLRRQSIRKSVSITSPKLE